MTNTEFENEFETGNLDDEYAEYIMDKAQGQRMICNGHTLLAAMEDGYLYDDFKDKKVDNVTA